MECKQLMLLLCSLRSFEVCEKRKSVNDSKNYLLVYKRKFRLCFFQDDANWKQYAVHAPDVPVQKESSQPLDNILCSQQSLIKCMCNYFNATSL